MSDPLPPSQRDTSLQQTTTGDRNQTIGQVLGGMVVYVSGGQAIINTGREEPAPNEKAIPVGPNPYKGLTAFQETDGDRFFGREKQIAALWEKLRSLHETKSTIRVLPIYGPSGSGKSSLARAGLIPELARHPIPGYDRARVAILVPGTHPLESLATVLARIVTQDLTPVAKTREFAGELKQGNEAGEYDGLRRIADVMPDIAIAPLVVLVDQFEEVYTLCEDKTERDAFIGNLLHAAGDRAKRVTVIITLRSDFLGETQKHPVLNGLFSEQGYLVPAMTPEELRQAIAKPAELAGHSLDSATIDLLVKDTEGREGALPLLQFALTRIWEGLDEGKSPAETLKAIGGVGGALAGEAQRIYDSLDEEGRAIARRLFLGLVQLGEGTKDTRRRAFLDSLVSHQDQPTQVKQVIGLFASPGVRLITLSASSNTETAEVTHEALFDHWQQLQGWLEGGRSDIRFQRRLDEAARYWDENNRPEGNLWRPPDLDLLQQYHERPGNDLTPLQMEFFKASGQAEEHRKQKERDDLAFKEQAIKSQKRAIWALAALLIGALGSAIFAAYQLQQAQRQQIEQLLANARLSLGSQPLDGAIHALVAWKLNQSPLMQFRQYSGSTSLNALLLKLVQVSQEENRLQHKYAVSSVAFSPDGKTIVSGSDDGTIRLWNAQTGELMGQPLTGHDDVVRSVAFSPDGKTIASGSWDNTVRLWDAETGEPIEQPLTGHEDAVWSVAFSPDGKTIASGSSDSTVRLWDAETGESIGQPLTGHEDVVMSVAFSPDGKTIASGSSDSTVRLWDVQTGELMGQPLTGHENADTVRSVAFSPDGKTIVSGSDDGTVRLWNTQTREPIGQPLTGHEDAVMSVALSLDGKTIASGSWDNTVRLWDAETGEPIGQPLTGHEDVVMSVAFSPDGKTIASSSDDGTIRLWNAQIGKPMGQPLTGHEDAVMSVAFSPNGKTIVSGSDDGTVRLWDVQTGEPMGQPLTGHEDAVMSVAFSPDGKTIVSGSDDGTVRLWNAQARMPVGQPLTGHAGEVMSVAFSPDGKTVASGSSDSTVRLWDAQTRAPIGQPLTGHEDGVMSVAFSPDGKTIVSGSSDLTMRLWNAQTRAPIGQPLTGHAGEVMSVAFSPDGKTIASGSSDRTVRLWDAQTGVLTKQTLTGHDDVVWTVAFSPDGKTIASSSSDRTVRLWNAETGAPTGQTLTGHEHAVMSVAFSPDGKAVSGSWDNTLQLWDMSLQRLAQTLCDRLQYHPALVNPQTDTARQAQRTCQRFAGSNQ
jgi:uncharacterized delta-60 repeat protein